MSDPWDSVPLGDIARGAATAGKLFVACCLGAWLGIAFVSALCHEVDDGTPSLAMRERGIVKVSPMTTKTRRGR